MKISSIRIILAGSLAVIGGIMFLDKNNVFSLADFAVGAFAFAALKPDSEEYMGDPVELREKFLNSTTAKQFGLKSIRTIDPTKLEYETMINRATDDEIVVFYKLSPSGWYDIEVWKKKFKTGEVPLLATYNHSVEERSLGVFRTAIRNAYASYGIKGALNYLKKQGIDKDMLGAIGKEKKEGKGE